jgi:protein-L-isoaspartate(D-aspartate) O-methyltransferase
MRSDPRRRSAAFPARLEPREAGVVRPPAGKPLLPQRPLQQAVADAKRRHVPSGLGLDSQGVRQTMVARLRAAGIRNEAVLAALAAVQRHAFVDTALANQAYEDTSLPIGHGQTISKPSVVARMIELLLDGRTVTARPLGRVLEIGTGCGYQAAVLSRLARSVVSVERLRPLYDKARNNLAPVRGSAGTGDIRLVYGDGRLGHAPNAPYDAIIAAAGADDLCETWLEQLAVGGRLVAPTRAPGGEGQVLVVVERHAAGLRKVIGDAVQFVPLKSGIG